MTDKTGGPAFPGKDRSVLPDLAGSDEWQGVLPTISTPGMTLRDYFAIHCDQPGEAEIIVAAGLSPKTPSGHFLYVNGEQKTFAEWWQELPQARRFELYAKVRYGLADAMLAARTADPDERKG